MKAGEKLIYRPTSQARLHRTLFGLFTLLAWTIYLYLWAPLATLGLWLAGMRTAYLQVYLQQHAVNVGLLLQLATIAACCAAVLIGWAEYNRIRFQGIDRRAPQPNATIEQIAERLHADADQVRTLQTARIATVRLGERIDLLSPLQAPDSDPLHAPVPLDDSTGNATPQPTFPAPSLPA